MEKGKHKIYNKKEVRNNYKNTRIAIQNNEPNYISKFKSDSHKIELAELSEKEFIFEASEFFYGDLIYKKYFEAGELFSLNKNSSYKEIQKINLLLEELKKNETGSPRVIFFQSPPMIGISYIIRFFNKKGFKFYLFSQTYGIDNKNNYKQYLNKDELYSDDYKNGSLSFSYLRLFEILKEEHDTTYFIILKNIPFDLFLLALKDNNFTPNFLKNWKPTIMHFFSEIKNLLNKKETNIKLLFITDDKEIDEFELKTIFPKDIIEHPLTKNIICNPISKRRMSDILHTFLNILSPKIIDENNMNTFIESIYLEFNSNLQQILEYLLLKITTEFYHYNKNDKNNQSQFSIYQKPHTQKRENIIKQCTQSQNKTKNKFNKNNNKANNKDFQIKKEKILDHDLFRLLGKLLYNKRYVTKKNSIEKLKKEEFGNNLETPRYYNINELINDIPISNNAFNDLLIFNSIEHFNDIGEYSDVFDLYSYTDTIDNFNSFLYDKGEQFFLNNSYMKIYLNCLGVTSYNLSQYNINTKFNPIISQKKLLTIKKPEFKINKNINKFNDQIYYRACEHYPSLISINLEDFYKEGFYTIYKQKFENEVDNINNYNKKNNCENINNINKYYKEKINNKFFGSTQKENNINKGNYIDNNTPKSVKFRNIPEEDQKALDKFLNDIEGESETDNEIEE